MPWYSDHTEISLRGQFKIEPHPHWSPLGVYSQGRSRIACALNESIIWKMNPLAVAATSLQFKSAFLHA